MSSSLLFVLWEREKGFLTEWNSCDCLLCCSWSYMVFTAGWRSKTNSAGAKQKLRWLSRLSHSVKQLFLSSNLGRSGKTYIAIGFVRERKASWRSLRVKYLFFTICVAKKLYHGFYFQRSLSSGISKMVPVSYNMQFIICLLAVKEELITESGMVCA